MNIQDTSCLKMLQEFSAHQTVKISEQSLKRSAQLKKQMYIFLDLRKNGTTQEKSWVTVTPSLGEPWTRNTSMCHSEGRDVFLSEILEVQVPPKYYLSQRACLGILRRAAARGKKLPPLLKKALEQQAERMALP